MRLTKEAILNRVKVNENGCWIWQKYGTQHNDYGQFCVYNPDGSRKAWRAHRASYTVFKGDPGNLNVLHKCNTRACCNPDHLYLGTHSDNTRDLYASGYTQQKKLTQLDILEICSSNEPALVLAVHYNVSHTTILKVRRNEY